MIPKTTTLRKISDGVFQEADPPADRSRPLEWRRSFNFISLPLKSLQLIHSHSVHETEFTLDEEKLQKPIDLIKPNIASKIMVRGVLDTEQFRDYIYFAVENKEQGTYSVEKATGISYVTLNVRKPTEASDRAPAGIFWGNAFSTSFKGAEELCFDVSMPEEQMRSIKEALSENESLSITVDAYLLSFTYEVDDFLREPWHSRDIFILDPTLCLLSRVTVASKIGPQVVPVEPLDEEEAERESYQAELTPEQKTSQELIAALSSFNKPLNSLVRAVWVLIAVVVLIYFFG